jgi:hypothetical protein
MKDATRVFLEAKLEKAGFAREGHGLEAPNGTLGIADSLLRRASVGELLEAMVARREKIPDGKESKDARADTQLVIEALKALVDEAL